MNVLNEENMYIIPIPTRIIIVGLSFLNDDTNIMAADGIRANTNALTIVAASPPMNGMTQTP